MPWDRSVVLSSASGTGKFHPWAGIVGKVNPSGSFSVGGPKEVGYTVAAALEKPESPNGKQIRLADNK